MSFSSALIETRLQDEYSASRVENPERGVRYWLGVEIPSDRWFQVEICENDEQSSERRIRRYITPYFVHALALQRSSKCDWVSLFMYVRAPLLSQSGYYFEEIAEAYRLPGDRGYFYVFKSGLSIFDSEQACGIGLDLQSADRVFPSKSS